MNDEQRGNVSELTALAIRYTEAERLLRSTQKRVAILRQEIAEYEAVVANYKAEIDNLATEIVDISGRIAGDRLVG